MKCDNCFCIYQSKGNCTAKEISLDISGMCTECIYADIDESVLDQAKFKILKLHEED